MSHVTHTLMHMSSGSSASGGWGVHLSHVTPERIMSHIQTGRDSSVFEGGEVLRYIAHKNASRHTYTHTHEQ